MEAKQKELMGLDQIGIALSGVIAVWLTQDKRESWRRWACIFGLLAQPSWFYAAWKAEQWGILAISTLYTYAWARGVRTHWLASERTGSAPSVAFRRGQFVLGGSSCRCAALQWSASPEVSSRS